MQDLFCDGVWGGGAVRADAVGKGTGSALHLAAWTPNLYKLIG